MLCLLGKVLRLSDLSEFQAFEGSSTHEVCVWEGLGLGMVSTASSVFLLVLWLLAVLAEICAG